MAKKNLSKQKKMDTRVNFTPMVDMMMLLITFFMLCTTLAKPQAMQLTMPSNDDTKNLNEEDKQVTKASHTITLYLGSNDKVWYIAGLPNYDDPSCVKETTYGKDGIEKVPTMTVIIRPLDTATYENMVAALDEMLISNIDKYVIDNVDKMAPEDKELIEKAGVK